ncbi:radical SAM family heme chaperone HemW [Cellulomonas fimi]|uniref:Heme chaperone HemW n=1 Tax=Cellulomonas fimi (strain ATCC 484 / DSM 20113 / JCM 1341 / CCUG 24087 / LMG 16345 / NBRC 15513 / NCIMB 8980 / NCTC 7547 / NRS-133) TaxID=590998 RepID=F4H3D8_CELFA|nr:radical SAM family heme chaperone HemW [Cellulomonas fimi]AEE46483.1 oxygen-independent coproporphyrinogen III oxidase [Cellulomonas fimi ATCC 484]NNH08237.1 coproporphyrinogen III oxidase [Cellulomonas fimi]VEH33174.1 Oxygen-independent coproporphyrinogen-III oxidase [Cellulomonas fimi]
MAPALPDGDPAPDDGALPASVRDGAAARAFGVYLHVPFCTVRCGYCDFNTYTATELGGGASQDAYAATALAEVGLAAHVLDAAGLPARAVSTVFVGGGTPTVLPVDDLARLLGGVRDTWGLTPDAEVTTEANPDSVTPASLAALAAAGFTRVSFGMQSAVPHVLATLERTHDPRRIPDVVRWARDAGLAVSLDLIYGTPGESLDDWRASVETALATGVDHVSAYALVVEQGTRMAVQVRRGELALPDADDQAAKYELADDLLTAAGLAWYEVSNWARTPADACRHNLAYWRGDDWWGVGPGAHSHVGGVRWWNVKHPRAYADRLARGLSPAAGREVVDGESAALERLMLGVRTAHGLPVADLSPDARRAVAGLVADGLVDGRAALARPTADDPVGPRVLLTRRGRLLADAVVRALAG